MNLAGRLLLSLTLLLGGALAGGCAPGKEENAYLAHPAVGDLYAVELSHFSAADFEGKTVYGLMKIVEVMPDKVIFVTESGGWPQPQGAKNDLDGDPSDITWDESERIPVKRADLPGYYGSEIIEVRRLEGAHYDQTPETP